MEPRYTWADIAKSDVITVSCPTGHSVDYVEAGGMYFPTLWKSGFAPDQRINVQRVRQMKARTDDVLICAFPKAGTHWSWEITQMLLKGKAEYSKKSKESVMLDFHIPAEFDDLPSPRVFNTHYGPSSIPKDMIDKKCKIIYIQRNPKDVAVSLYHFAKNMISAEFAGSWNDYFYMFLNDAHVYNNWFTNTLLWEKALKDNPNLNVLSLFYEDLKQDPIREITKMAKFLEVSYTADFIAEIADKCSFKKMKAGDKEHRKEELKKMSKLFNDKMVTDGDPTEKMSNVMYRKGDVGDWKNWFTVAQEEMFDAIYEERMKDSKLKFKFTL